MVYLEDRSITFLSQTLTLEGANFSIMNTNELQKELEAQHNSNLIGITMGRWEKCKRKYQPRKLWKRLTPQEDMPRIALYPKWNMNLDITLGSSPRIYIYQHQKEPSKLSQLQHVFTINLPSYTPCDVFPICSSSDQPAHLHLHTSHTQLSEAKCLQGRGKSVFIVGFISPDWIAVFKFPCRWTNIECLLVPSPRSFWGACSSTRSFTGPGWNWRWMRRRWRRTVRLMEILWLSYDSFH